MLASQKGLFEIPKTEAKMNVFPWVYPHAGLETGLSVQPDWESNGGPNIRGSQKSP